MNVGGGLRKLKGKIKHNKNITTYEEMLIENKALSVQNRSFNYFRKEVFNPEIIIYDTVLERVPSLIIN